MEMIAVTDRPCSCSWIESNGELFRQYGDPFCRMHGQEDAIRLLDRERVTIQDHDRALSMRIVMEGGLTDDANDDNCRELKDDIQRVLDKWNKTHAPENLALVEDI